MDWKLAVEVSGSVLAGLFVVPFSIATIRAIFEGDAEPWEPSDVEAAEAQAAKEMWPHRILVALDTFLNVVILFGYQAETISSHAWRASLERHWWGVAMTKWLGWIQSNHGQKAASGDLERATAEVARLNKLLGV